MKLQEQIEALVESNTTFCSDAEQYTQFELATKSFEKLVKEGLASKRGYQLLPINSRVFNDVLLNRGTQE